MELAERLRERLKREFGIETPEDLERACEALDLDLGIFTTMLGEGEAHAS